MSIRLDASVEELREAFFDLETQQDVADLLEVPYRKLIYHLWHVEEDDKYLTFFVRKRRGGSRKIQVPATALKLIQRKLNQVLQAVYEPKDCTHGFVPGRSIVTNARQHKGKRWVFTADIEDFFPSINFGRVFGLFQARPYNRNHNVATVFAQASCYKNELPQGAPTSPVVANMIAARLDSELQRLAGTLRCTYTRYADDLTFSTDVQRFPREIGWLKDEAGETVAKAGPALRKVVRSNGFRLNDEKVDLRRYDHRQVVTGIKVNKRLNVHKSCLSQIRAMLHAWQKFGEEAAEKEYYAKYNDKHRNPALELPSFRNVVWGKIQFVKMVRGSGDGRYQRFLTKYLNLTDQWTTPDDAIWLLQSDRHMVDGTGFVLEGVGLVTCEHVAYEDTVAFRPTAEEERHQTEIVAANEELDLAILRIDADDLHFLSPGSSSDLSQGDEVTVLGWPRGWAPGTPLHRYPEVKIVAIMPRHGQRYLRLDGGIHPGMSGGPVLNSENQVVGIAQRGHQPGESVDDYYPPVAICIEALTHLID